MQRKLNPHPHIKFAPNFDQDIDNAPIDVQIIFREVYELFNDDPGNVLLRNIH